MSLLRWGMGGDFDHVAGLYWDTRLVGYRKIPARQWAKLPRYRAWGAVEVRPFTAKKRLRASEAQGLSGEAVKGNPMTTVIPRVDESKSGPIDQPETWQNQQFLWTNHRETETAAIRFRQPGDCPEHAPWHWPLEMRLTRV